MRKRKKDIKERQLQMNFAGQRECDENCCEVLEAVVHRLQHGAVSPVWLSACQRERTLTTGLMEQVASLPNLQAAYRMVKRNKGSGGVDGMDIKGFRKWGKTGIRELQEQLITGTYAPQPVRCVMIPKPQGGERQLGIPTLIDRMVQQAIHQVLNPRYEQIFSANSYGFRRGRGAHDALLKASQYVKEGKSWVIDLDLEKFFDKVNHSRLLWVLSNRIADRRVIQLISRMLSSGMMQDGLLSQRTEGTPQGGPLSPLLSNIVLDELDKELERRGYDYVRYADDVKILVTSAHRAERVMAKITAYIEDKLLLKVNRNKSRVCRSWDLTFLGHRIFADGGLGLGEGSERRFKAKLKAITSRRRGISLGRMIKELKDVTRGWIIYYRSARMKSKMEQIDGWLRRRLRCFRLKQCKRTIGMVRFLIKEGVEKTLAWRLALSGKGWWRLSNSPASNIAMNRDWFNREGYQSLKVYYEQVNRFKL